MPSSVRFRQRSSHICDMIKGNESNVGNIDLELKAKKGDKFLCFTLFLDLENCSYISATRCLIDMGFGSKCSILNEEVIYIEKSILNFADMWLIPLDRVTYVGMNPFVIQLHLQNSWNLNEQKH